MLVVKLAAIAKCCETQLLLRLTMLTQLGTTEATSQNTKMVSAKVIEVPAKTIRRLERFTLSVLLAGNGSGNSSTSYRTVRAVSDIFAALRQKRPKHLGRLRINCEIQRWNLRVDIMQIILLYRPARNTYD
mgnify:CR=1 FL=1